MATKAAKTAKNSSMIDDLKWIKGWEKLKSCTPDQIKTFSAKLEAFRQKQKCLQFPEIVDLVEIVSVKQAEERPYGHYVDFYYRDKGSVGSNLILGGFYV